MPHTYSYESEEYGFLGHIWPQVFAHSLIYAPCPHSMQYRSENLGKRMTLFGQKMYILNMIKVFVKNQITKITTSPRIGDEHAHTQMWDP